MTAIARHRAASRPFRDIRLFCRRVWDAYVVLDFRTHTHRR